MEGRREGMSCAMLENKRERVEVSDFGARSVTSVETHFLLFDERIVADGRKESLGVLYM